MKTNRGIAHLFLLLVVIFVAIVAVGYLAYQNAQSKNDSKDKSQSSLTEELKPTPHDFVSDGVYTNNKYKFSFEYPDDIFIAFNNTREKVITFKDVESPEYPNKYWMVLSIKLDSTSVSNPDGNQIPFYENYQMANNTSYFDSVEEKNHINNYLKVKNITANYTGYILYTYNTPYADGIEPATAHRVDLLHDNLLITLSIVSPFPKKSDKLKEERLEMLETIIESLRFFND